MVEIDWEIFGVDEFADELENLGWRALNLAPAMHKVGEMWQEWIEEQFATQGVRFLGHKWTKLAPATISKKRSTTILIESSDLLIEMTDPDNIRADNDSVTFSVSEGPARYGAFHQTGASRRIGGAEGGEWSMPARPILHFGPIDNQRSVDVIEDWVIEGII